MRQVVRQHGGSVTAERAPGGGTLMRVRLPGAETVAPESAPPREASVASTIFARSVRGEQRLLAKARRREAVAAAERAREMRRLAVADQTRDIAHRDRPLLDQQLGRGGHPPREQVLLEGDLAELRIGALQLPRRARQRAAATI